MDSSFKCICKHVNLKVSRAYNTIKILNKKISIIGVMRENYDMKPIKVKLQPYFQVDTL
jgi:hypothetical protein